MADTPLDNSVSVRFVICDDLRQEVHGKHSLIGVYGHMMGITASPAVLPKLVIATQLTVPAHYAGREMTLQVTDGPTTVARIEMVLNAQPPHPDPRFNQRMNLTVPLEIVGFEVRDGMQLAVQLTLGDLQIHSEPLMVACAATPTNH